MYFVRPTFSAWPNYFGENGHLHQTAETSYSPVHHELVSLLKIETIVSMCGIDLIMAPIYGDTFGICLLNRQYQTTSLPTPSLFVHHPGNQATLTYLDATQHES